MTSFNNDLIDTFGSYMIIVQILIYLSAIGLAWWGLQEVRFDVFLRRPKSPAAKMLQILLAITIGSSVAGFFMSYLGLSVKLGFFS
ncbi:DUF1146 domain-containing protein [Paenibacillus sp. N1-5-1-14]|uniref:DUF1146 domain-containing protein n=1 Tax=Paenibacillus radicibacter TaxID=2972488 RepID=UPI00215991B2|nr:DUF1146 domain-containing protein [Paenibacillus radicibacter]MCR8645076.1 DUF1146 domain-containing protein [Paenibacillus radicibacter]